MISNKIRFSNIDRTSHSNLEDPMQSTNRSNSAIVRDERAGVGRIDSPGLVPVVVRSERATPAPTEASGMYGAAGELGETYMITKEVLSL